MLEEGEAIFLEMPSGVLPSGSSTLRVNGEV